jgi:hypothetical protein
MAEIRAASPDRGWSADSAPDCPCAARGGALAAPVSGAHAVPRARRGAQRSGAAGGAARRALEHLEGLALGWVRVVGRVEQVLDPDEHLLDRDRRLPVLVLVEDRQADRPRRVDLRGARARVSW